MTKVLPFSAINSSSAKFFQFLKQNFLILDKVRVIRNSQFSLYEICDIMTRSFTSQVAILLNLRIYDKLNFYRKKLSYCTTVTFVFTGHANFIIFDSDFKLRFLFYYKTLQD